MFTAISAVPDDDSLFVLGTALGEVKCVRHVLGLDKKILEALDQGEPEWEAHVTAYSISCIMVHGKTILVGDGDGSAILLELDTGMELRRYQMEAAVVAASWHNGVFVVGDLVGNMIGVDDFDMRWSQRMDIVQLDNASFGNTSMSTTILPPHSISLVAALASISLVDCEDQACSYVAVSLGRQDLLLTHKGNVLSFLAAPTPITAIHFCPVSSVVLCGGENGIVYTLVAEGGSVSTGSSAYSIQFKPVAEIGFRVDQILSSSLKGRWVAASRNAREVVEFDADGHHARHPAAQELPVGVACAQGHVFLLGHAGVEFRPMVSTL
ncbi:Aste57867_11176 [Aphanomyces stellatus]|uniref:Aste57867_11176 protein n=1 Tax=Aphanomyces stellatus TaxID=120398 RepID=A0A485KS73_9STRA|nr:hypothetical protein As57867_011134 [Aphanomyces stellatus]VFT88043.1 Aste57867_11176 [Aphanomyces stellatus]